jgi:UDP:flavonoid glycosyltransferase YjiC (YdhE family)
MASPEAIGDVPGHVSVEEWVPQRDVLRHVDLVVSHGGSGTTLDALANGLPHLVIPQGADQFGNAQMVSTAGVGRRVMPREFSGDAIAEHARALLGDEEVRARAAELAQEIAAMPSPAETVDRLVKLAG